MNKFSISQLALPQPLNTKHLDFLRGLNILGIELLPARITNNWTETDQYRISVFADLMSENCIATPAFQGIFFQTPFDSFFNKYLYNDFINHTKLLSKIALLLNTKILILGAPKLRQINNLYTYRETYLMALNLFREMAEISFSNGLKLCIEACSTNYGNSFLRNHLEIIDFIKEINHPGIGFHIDSTILYENQESLPELLNSTIPLDHFHLSESNLTEYVNKSINYFDYIKNLDDINFKNWITFEFIFKQPLLSNQFPSEFIKHIVAAGS